MNSPTDKTTWGLYFHVPFCEFACHYCDFVKTANFDQTKTQKYFSALELHLAYWLKELNITANQIDSVFFGGGTPGLFAEEYLPLFTQFRPLLTANAEVSLEVNPRDINVDSLQNWLDIGFTRLSVGIQTLDSQGLKFLTRNHSVREVYAAIQNARLYFDNINIDLIYGWPGQTLESWTDDLEFVIEQNLPHVSLYNLTYEQGTPLGRAKKGGKILDVSQEAEFEFYTFACKFLRSHGYQQEEVSNWSREGYRCLHNHKYWGGHTYIGIGAGAHGFIRHKKWLGKDLPKHGMRYAYERNIEAFCDNNNFNVAIDERNYDSWLMEYISCRMRTAEGLDLDLLKQDFGVHLNMQTQEIADGLATGALLLRAPHLRLAPSELFREQAWTLKICENIKN